MPHDVISTCPVCSGELAVTRLHCRSCGTTLEGDFSVGRFGRLSRDQLALLESFLRSRGNLRDMERELGLSYPTVRSRVEALVRSLGFGPRGDADETAPEASDPASAAVDANAILASRQQILERLARDEIGAEDAADAIRALGRTVRLPHRRTAPRSSTTSGRPGAFPSASCPARSRCAALTGTWSRSASATASRSARASGSRQRTAACR